MTVEDLTPNVFFSGTAIWGFASNGRAYLHFYLDMQMSDFFVFLVAANTARDVGGRLVAISIWGTRAAGGKYAAIAALTNIVSTVAAYAFYEFIFKDSSRGNVVHCHYSCFSWTKQHFCRTSAYRH